MTARSRLLVCQPGWAEVDQSSVAHTVVCVLTWLSSRDCMSTSNLSLRASSLRQGLAPIAMHAAFAPGAVRNLRCSMHAAM
jgi:hypothetical protein